MGRNGATAQRRIEAVARLKSKDTKGQGIKVQRPVMPNDHKPLALRAPDESLGRVASGRRPAVLRLSGRVKTQVTRHKRSRHQGSKACTAERPQAACAPRTTENHRPCSKWPEASGSWVEFNGQWLVAYRPKATGAMASGITVGGQPHRSCSVFGPPAALTANQPTTALRAPAGMQPSTGLLDMDREARSQAHRCPLPGMIRLFTFRLP